MRHMAAPAALLACLVALGCAGDQAIVSLAYDRTIDIIGPVGPGDGGGLDGGSLEVIDLFSVPFMSYRVAVQESDTLGTVRELSVGYDVALLAAALCDTFSSTWFSFEPFAGVWAWDATPERSGTLLGFRTGVRTRLGRGALSLLYRDCALKRADGKEDVSLRALSVGYGLAF